MTTIYHYIEMLDKIRQFAGDHPEIAEIQEKILKRQAKEKLTPEQLQDLELILKEKF